VDGHDRLGLGDPRDRSAMTLILACDWPEWEHAIQTVGPSWVSCHCPNLSALDSGMHACVGGKQRYHACKGGASHESNCGELIFNSITWAPRIWRPWDNLFDCRVLFRSKDIRGVQFVRPILIFRTKRY
jgi:hypothetical protein